MVNKSNLTLSLLHLIFPLSYHRYAWAFTMLKSVHMSRIQYDALSVKQFQRGNQNMYIGEKQKTQNDVFF